MCVLIVTHFFLLFFVDLRPTHQVFSPEDEMCSGDLRLEMVMFPRAAEGDRDGGMCAVGHFEDGSTKYYR